MYHVTGDWWCFEPLNHKGDWKDDQLVTTSTKELIRHTVLFAWQGFLEAATGPGKPCQEQALVGNKWA